MKKKLSQKIKSLSLALLCSITLSQSLFIAASAAPEWPGYDAGIEALSGIVIDADSGAVLYQKDADTPYPPASITKILTALVVLEKCENLNDMVVFSETAIERVEWDSGNKTNVVAGDKLTVEDCLYALLLSSSNQTANALAEYIAGDIDSFVIMMNEKVRELGLTASNFENPSGLNGDTQNVTAREMAIIAQAAYANPKLLEINSTSTYRLAPMENTPGGMTLTHEHRLVKTTDEANEYYYAPAIAGKPGYLLKAGNTLVTYGEVDGQRLIAVVLKGQPRQYFIDSKNMLQFGFANFENHNIMEKDSQILSDDRIETLKNAGINTNNLILTNDSVITLPTGTAFEAAESRLVTDLPASYPEGAVAMVEYTYNDRAVGSIYILQPRKEEVSIIQPPLPGANIDDEGGIITTMNREETVKKKSFRFLPFFLILMTMIGLGTGFFYIQRQKEARAREARRKKRQSRLRELGVSPEEFEQMMRSSKKGRKRTSRFDFSSR